MMRDRLHTEAACNMGAAARIDADMARRQAAVDRSLRRRAAEDAERRRRREESIGRRAVRMEARRAAVAAAVSALSQGVDPQCKDEGVLRAARAELAKMRRGERRAESKARRGADDAESKARRGADDAERRRRAAAVTDAVTAVEVATGRTADGRCMRAGGCSRTAIRSEVGPFCARCIASARTCCSTSGRPTVESVRAWLLDGRKRAEANGMRVAWDRADWTLSNIEIARAMGCTQEAVRNARRRLGAPPSPMSGNTKLGIDWGSVRLGERTDREVSAELGVPVHAVGAARRALGIPALDPRDERKRLAVEVAIHAGLGMRSDAEIAHELGVSRRSVTRIRTRMGIAPAPRGASRIRPPDVDWDAVGLGTIPDERIAIVHNVPPTTVRMQRLMRGIPPATRGPAPRDIDWDAVDWTSLSDRAIAGRLGIDSRRVRDMREQLGKPRPPHASRRTRRAEPSEQAP